MAEGMSREVWFLHQVEKQKYSEDFVQNITQVNQTLTSLSKYLISMQKGIDDLGRDIFEVIGDFVDELIILFGGGTGLDFGLDGLVPVVQKLIGNIPILADLIEILSGIEDGNVNDVGTFINRLLENIFGGFGNANRVLLELQAKLSEGATFHDTFDRPNSTTLGNGWIQGGNGSELQIIDNAARINGPASYGEGRRYAICPKVADQNDMAVSVGVNNKGVAQGACTTIILHSNADMTEFVYANLFLARFYIGRGTRSGNNWTFNDWKSSVDQKRLTEGGMVEFTAKNNTYKLSCNGSTLVEHNDTSDFPRDENHRYSGFAQQTTIFVLPAFSWGVVAYTMRSQVVLTAVQSAITKADDAKNTATSASNTATAANNTAIAANNNATTASNVATEANNKVDAVSGAVQSAVDDAAEALERADIAYANASYWEAECVVSSAEVLIGVNELLIGLCQNVPTGKVRKVTDIHFAFNSNPGGATIQTKKWNSAGTSSSVIHTATISAGTIRIGYNNLDVSVSDKERIFWDVTALGGTVPPTVLQCLVFGVIL